MFNHVFPMRIDAVEAVMAVFAPIYIAMTIAQVMSYSMTIFKDGLTAVAGI
jgi:hypothetical protein